VQIVGRKYPDSVTMWLILTKISAFAIWVQFSEIFGWFYRKGQEKSFNMLLENQGAKHCQRFQIRGGKTWEVLSLKNRSAAESTERKGSPVGAETRRIGR